ncbi:chemotaxis protein CheB [Mariniblastus sp.]|nr:chemotaxis protein CheB [Mariniblastus sp.]
MSVEPTSTYTNLIVAIGGSAGGNQEIVTIISKLPEDYQGCIVVATHRAPTHTNTLAKVLGFKAQVEISEPFDHECLECTTVFIGAPDQKVEVNYDQFDIERDPTGKSKLKRIDDLFSSVAKSAKHNAVGVILSGAMSDGVQGLKDIHDAGGFCIVQDPKDAQFDSMPNNALAEVDANFVGTAEEIADVLIEIASGRKCRPQD